MGLSPSKKVVLFASRMMKNVSYFTLKALFVLEIFKFASWLFGYVEKQLDVKDEVYFEIHDVTERTTNSYNTCISNILRSKSNQTMKSGHLIKYNMTNIFLKKSYTKCGGKLVPDLL